MWEVRFKKKAQKDLTKLPKTIQAKVAALVFDLEIKGLNPGPKWHNFSKLSGDKYHCHLNYSYVACWEQVGKEIQLIEVYYVGSRESAPY